MYLSLKKKKRYLPTYYVETNITKLVGINLKHPKVFKKSTHVCTKYPQFQLKFHPKPFDSNFAASQWTLIN